MMIETIETLKHKYANEWLAVKVTREENWKPLEGELVAHGARSEVSEAIRENDDSLYIFYAGQEIPSGVLYVLISGNTDWFSDTGPSDHQAQALSHVAAAA